MKYRISQPPPVWFWDTDTFLQDKQDVFVITSCILFYCKHAISSASLTKKKPNKLHNSFFAFNCSFFRISALFFLTTNEYMLIIIYAHWYNHNKSIKRFAIRPTKVRNPPENQEMEELIKIATSPMKKNSLSFRQRLNGYGLKAQNDMVSLAMGTDG